VLQPIPLKKFFPLQPRVSNATNARALSHPRRAKQGADSSTGKIIAPASAFRKGNVIDVSFSDPALRPRSRAFSSWPGLTRPSTACRFNDESNLAAPNCKYLSGRLFPRENPFRRRSNALSTWIALWWAHLEGGKPIAGCGGICSENAIGRAVFSPRSQSTSLDPTRAIRPSATSITHE
jgi:hypothetical protein